MASVLDRPMFQKNATESRDRLKQLGNIGSYNFGEALPIVDVFQDTTERAAQDAVPPASTIPKVVAPAQEGKRYVIGRAVFVKKPNGIVTYENGDPIDIGQAETIRGIIAQQDRNAGQELAQRNERALAGMYEGEFPVSGKVPPPQPLKSDMEADARGQSVRTFVDGKPMTAADLPAFKGRLENQAGPSGMEAEARKMPQGPQGAPVAPKGPSDMEADARGRKPLVSNPAEVAAGLNDPTPEVREKTAADFAKQFADMGPKYEGIDKGLLLAQIGFAIAAGDSPNAMSNIANGLSLGADTAIKDKAAKAEFDRQIQLTAMQYGLEKYDQEQQRAKEPIKFVALTDTTYEGKKVPAGTAVYIPYGKIEKNGGMVPPGFGDTEMISALATKKSAMLELMQKTYEQGLIDDTFLASETKTYSEAASSAISAQRALDYLDSAMLQVGQGGVTGLEGSAKSLAAKLASAAGLPDVAAQFTDRDEFVATMKLAFQEMMPASLSGVQSANSISDRDVKMMAEAFANAALKDGVFSLAFVSDDTLLNQLKAASNKMQSARQQSLATMGGVEKAFSGRYLRSGTIDNPVSALTALDPYKSILGEQTQTSTPSQFGSLVLGENGVYEIVIPER